MHPGRSISAVLVIVGTVMSPLGTIFSPQGTMAVAQLVDIRPGYVRAPFVRVYSYPDGSSYVRAPFVSVYSPPRAFVRPSPYFYSTPRVSESVNEFGNLDWHELRLRIREGIPRLQRSLARTARYSEWRDYLMTDVLAELVVDDNDDPPGPEEVDQLRKILANYQATLNSTDLQQVTTVDGFHTVYGALVELVTPPLERQHQMLDRARRQLRDDLSRISAPASWRSFLQLPQNVTDPSQGDVTPTPDSLVDGMESLRKTLDRYEQVSQDPQFRMIAELPGFRETQRRLAQYLNVMQIWPAGDVEELPLPNSEDDTQPPPEPQP